MKSVLAPQLAQEVKRGSGSLEGGETLLGHPSLQYN